MTIVEIYHGLHQVTGAMAKEAFGPQLTAAMLKAWAVDLDKIAVAMKQSAVAMGKNRKKS